MRTLIESVCILAVATASFAQTARQGEPQADPTEFHSPMVLEAPFIAASPEFWKGKERGISSGDLQALKRFHCDGVSVVSVVLYPREVSEDRVQTRIEVEVSNPGHDKFVKLLFQLFNGDTMAGEASIGPFKNKEDSVVHHEARLVAKKSDLKTEPLTNLRITMTNWDY